MLYYSTHALCFMLRVSLIYVDEHDESGFITNIYMEHVHVHYSVDRSSQNKLQLMLVMTKDLIH